MMQSSRRSFGIALGAAVATLVAGGVADRRMAGELDRIGTATALRRGTLSRLPMQMGRWMGQDIRLDPRVVRATDTEDHVSRVYARPGSPDAVSLFVGHGVRLRDLSRHRPEVCYTSAGWTLEETTDGTVRAADGGEIPVRTYWFSRGGLRTAWVAVLNYFIVDGVPVRDGGSLRWRFWKGSGGTSHVAQVQIACVSMDRAGETMDLVNEFAAQVAPIVAALLQEPTAPGVSQDE